VAGIQTGKGGGKLTYTQVFGDWLCDMAARCEQADGGHAGDARGLRHGAFAEEYPKRYFDVGIAEQHALTFAAGMACEGVKPVVAIYSTFLQRAYDQLIHDVCLQNLPVMMALDRAGLVGADGATHHGAFDLSYLLCPAEHRRNDAERRERVPADAVHRLSARRAQARCAIRAAAARAWCRSRT
jgi:1-deoxy-D-xylulose-5-phosphate synthase